MFNHFLVEGKLGVSMRLGKIKQMGRAKESSESE